MRSVLHEALSHGHDAVVLGALGSGAFKNEPSAIAALFADLLKNEFDGQFAVAAFAVIFSQRNLEAFEAHFPLLEGATAEERISALAGLSSFCPRPANGCENDP